MRVFVAGASGALGRPLIPRLVEAGHEVTGMTRSRDRAAEIEAAGAAAVVCDVFNPATLE
jgi:nucleoside-diphosphate-sugar epimerase